METIFGVSYWTDTDKQPDGKYKPEDSANMYVPLRSQTLLFENELDQVDNKKPKNHEDLNGVLLFVLEQMIRKSNGNTNGLKIHKIWIP